MKKSNRYLLPTLAAISIVGCSTDKTPEVITTPGSTTIVHDKTPSSPNVTINPPAQSSHTETNTVTTTPDPSSSTPDTSSSSTTKTTTTTTTG